LLRLCKIILVVCVTTVLGSCGGGSVGNLSDPGVTVGLNGAPSQNANLRYAPGDKIRVVVYGEESLTGEYEVDGNGLITLPLAGSVRAAGLTKAELERSIVAKLKRSDVLDPRVTVQSTDFRPFYVLGEVNKPGAYPYRSGLNVLSAIAIAGGATYRASSSNVYIQRSGSTELKKYPNEPNVKVMPGDVVKVPERYF
jgi:protein involved in polysaccharide export with SLBB domain